MRPRLWRLSWLWPLCSAGARESIMHTLAEQHAWLTRWVVDGEVSEAAQKRKDAKAAKEASERAVGVAAAVAAALPLAVLAALRAR